MTGQGAIEQVGPHVSLSLSHVTALPMSMTMGKPVQLSNSLFDMAAPIAADEQLARAGVCVE